MHKLMRLDAWREAYFTEPRPDIEDLQRNCKNGTLPAQKICKRWYVKIRGEHDLTLAHPKPITTGTGNSLADRLVQRVLADAVQ